MALVAARRHPRRRLPVWPLVSLPGMAWLVLFFLAPLYIVLCIVFGTTDAAFRTPVPIFDPLRWRAGQARYVLDRIVGQDAVFGPALLRTAIYVVLASALCLAIAFPVAYYVARLSGRRKGLILALLIAPFWISYMMRMLAWVNLLAVDGWVNKALGLGIFDVHIDWLTGRSVVVVLGLAYVYVPYMILPLYTGLDRLPQSMLEAARDLGADRPSSFIRVVLPMCRPTVIAALLLTSLPMLGDYFTNDLLSGSPRTAMVGNLINDTVLTPGETGYAGAFVLLVLLVSLVPMFYYLRSVSKSEQVAT